MANVPSTVSELLDEEVRLKAEKKAPKQKSREPKAQKVSTPQVKKVRYERVVIYGTEMGDNDWLPEDVLQKRWGLAGRYTFKSKWLWGLVIGAGIGFGIGMFLAVVHTMVAFILGQPILSVVGRLSYGFGLLPFGMLAGFIAASILRPSPMRFLIVEGRDEKGNRIVRPYEHSLLGMRDVLSSNGQQAGTNRPRVSIYSAQVCQALSQAPALEALWTLRADKWDRLMKMAGVGTIILGLVVAIFMFYMVTQGQ